MADYSGFITLAQRMIEENGALMTFRHAAESGPLDPVTGKRSVSVETKEFMGVCANPTSQELQSGLFAGVEMVTLAPGADIVNPKLSDTILFNNHEYNIVKIVMVAPAGDCILYKFGVQDKGQCQI